MSKVIRYKGVPHRKATDSDIGEVCLFVDNLRDPLAYSRYAELKDIVKDEFPFVDDNGAQWKHALIDISSQETKVAPEVSPPSESILDEAKRLVCGDRQASYGPPDQDFARTAGMINSLFRDYLKKGCEFKPKDVASIMILIKLSRNRHQNKRDNPVDITGYAHCLNVCMECEKPVDVSSTGSEVNDEHS